MSKILDGVAWLAASLGSVLEDVVIIVVIIKSLILVATIGLSYRVSSGVQIPIWISIRSPHAR